jgi:hypothetical protein
MTKILGYYTFLLARNSLPHNERSIPGRCGEYCTLGGGANPRTRPTTKSYVRMKLLRQDVSHVHNPQSIPVRGASDRCLVHYGSDRADISRRTLQTRGSTDLSRRRLDVDRCLGNGGR